MMRKERRRRRKKKRSRKSVRKEETGEGREWQERFSKNYVLMSCHTHSDE